MARAMTGAAGRLHLHVFQTHALGPRLFWSVPLLSPPFNRHRQGWQACGKFDRVACLGCVIKGGTAHFEFIILGATMGLMQSMLAARVPLAFGIFTLFS
ncbi:MAG: 6,7-dimethyl-8-ribityllumazine synthase [Alphaproteobacteria bacterium]|nr:6,7-dimethyl-8-ribityllumazine synthase [Alphaproteobacteria bacterium]